MTIIIGVMVYFLYVNQRIDYNPIIKQAIQNCDTIVMCEIYIDKDKNAVAEREVVLNTPPKINEFCAMIELELHPKCRRVHCMCSGNPRIKILKNDEVLFYFSIHHGHSVRISDDRIQSDIDLTDASSAKLISYFQSMGMQEYLNQ